MGHKGYKAFEKGLICRGKQYAENTVFEEENAEIFKHGMHYCENPFDVLAYYPLVNEDGSFNDFAEVEALDEPKTKDGDKFCTTKLKIGAKLSFAGFIRACIDYTKEVPTFKRGKNNGDYARIGSSGDCAKIVSSGSHTRIVSSGDYARLVSSGNDAQIGSSGNYARLVSSGNDAQIGSSGYSARIVSSGAYARIGSSGNDAQIGSLGYSARICSSGESSIIYCAGDRSIVKAKKGSWITLSEWKWSEEKERSVPVCVKTEYVDGERIKEDTFYRLVNGKFVEVL